MKKVLIIDDNHSFVDSLKVMLRDMSLQIESEYRFSIARDKLDKMGPYSNTNEIQNILEYERNLQLFNEKKSGKDKNDDSIEPPGQPVLVKPTFDNDGFSFVIIEEDTEVSIKGTQFIKDLLKSNENWKKENFILLTTKADVLEKTAKKLNISLFEKPIRQSTLKQLITDRIKKEEETQSIVHQIIKNRKLIFKEKITAKKSSLSTSKLKSVPKKNLLHKSVTKKSATKVTELKRTERKKTDTKKTGKKKTKISVLKK